MSTKPELTEREQEVLDELEDDRWLRPMDVGGRNRSHHSATLKSLVRKGYAVERRRDSLMNMLGSSRGSYVYRKVGAK